MLSWLKIGSCREVGSKKTKFLSQTIGSSIDAYGNGLQLQIVFPRDSQQKHALFWLQDIVGKGF